MDRGIVVIKLGGSLINPGKIDIKFLNEFQHLISKFLYRYKFVIICGGGSPCREYQEAAQLLGVNNHEAQDYIGIRMGHVNAELVKAMFGRFAHPEVVHNYHKPLRFQHIMLGAGWKPGHSHDFDAVMFGKAYKSKQVIILTNVPYIYDKDPNKYKSAQPFTNLKISKYISQEGEGWTPGLNLPVDPIAAKAAPRSMKLFVLAGLKNMEAVLSQAPFQGTVLEW